MSYFAIIGKRKGESVVRNLSKLLFQRVVVVSLSILLQIAFVLLSAFYLKDNQRWVGAVMTLLSWISVMHIMSGRNNPSYKIAWIVLILVFPVAGITIYLLFGGNKTSSRENKKMGAIEAVTLRSLTQDAPTLAALQDAAPAYNHARYLLEAAHYPVYRAGETVYFPDGESCYTQMLAELEKAEHYIFLEFFIIEKGVMWDGILEILHRKALAGVDVRVIYDDFGCITRLPMRYAKKLSELGIRAKAFNPYVPILSARLNNRDHRKLMIIDGRAAFTGGVNLADEYINRTHPYGRWKDCGLLVRGQPAWSMTVMFLSMWDYVAGLEAPVEAFRPLNVPQGEEKGFVQPFADSPIDGEDVGATVLQSLISGARRSIRIMTPYLILDDKMTSSLCVAAKSGVDVRIITPGVPDKWYVHAVTRANYELLTESGVRIFEFRPGFLHAKVCLVDGQSAMVGTVNLDFRSLYLHFEDAVHLHGTDSIAQIARDFEATFPECTEITSARCRHVYLHQRLGRTLLRMFSPLM